MACRTQVAAGTGPWYLRILRQRTPRLELDHRVILCRAGSLGPRNVAGFGRLLRVVAVSQHGLHLRGRPRQFFLHTRDALVAVALLLRSLVDPVDEAALDLRADAISRQQRLLDLRQQPL